ncbi:hypothetical protein BN948_01805 [Hydrogenophaga intermedia]|uniref:Uncharacterized protein n=1 Tax=Hydrogenophaga intermedia TaxID=65786 RepID=A0A1L1PHB0_HYDIT|nr:hypothetical protein [Hydrogenophaga intermedia]CDN87383.1 hypothetical protein BN948_01805 [Hydrogenophaga intermedia]
MNMQASPNEGHEYAGSPTEVGAQIVADSLGSAIEAANAGGASPQQVAQMLAGAIAAVAGMVATNYGADAAIDMLKGTVENIENNRAAFAPAPQLN